MKYLRKLSGATGSEVQLVEIDSTLWVKKKVDAMWVHTEKAFYNTLHSHSLPTLKTLDSADLGVDEILIEYIEGETTLENIQDTDAFAEWGKLMSKMHSIKYDTVYRFTPRGQKESHTWSSVMEEYSAVAVDRAERNSWYGLSKKEKDGILYCIEKVVADIPDSFSLIHGDPHSNNFLVEDGKIFAFDKNNEFFSGSTYIDLAIVLINFPNGSCANIKGPDYSDDHVKIAAFIDGYGQDFISDEMLSYYLVLIAFRRMNSPHAKYNKEIALNVLRKI